MPERCFAKAAGIADLQKTISVKHAKLYHNEAQSDRKSAGKPR